ncbi:MAG: aldo/keto reductase [Bacteriovoracales bacterium]
MLHDDHCQSRFLNDNSTFMNLNEALNAGPIGFGGASLSGEGGGYGFGAISDSDAEILLKTSLDRGIKIFDTAPIYGFGLSEQRIGKAFSHRRENIFIISKGGITWDLNKRVDINNSPQVIQKMLDQSLTTLNCEYIDLYMIHWPDPRIDIRLPLEFLSKKKSEGKIRMIGLCNTNVEDLLKAIEIDKIDMVQSEFNIFNKTALENIEDLIIKEKIPFMSWGTFDKGIITGKVKENSKFDSFDARSWAPWWKKSNKDIKIKKMEKILNFLQEKGHLGLELALAHNLSRPSVKNVLCGIKNVNQLNSIFSALKNLPSKEIIQEACDLL